MKNTIFVLLIILSFNVVPAQKKDSSYKYWLTIGARFGENLSLNFNYTFGKANNFYKVGYFTRGGYSRKPAPGKDGYLFNSVDISIGKRFQSEWFMVSAFSGPAYVFGEERNSPGNYDKYNTIGIDSYIQLLFRLADEIGIGIGIYGNLNFIRNYAGVNVNITIGNGK